MLDISPIDTLPESTSNGELNLEEYIVICDAGSLATVTGCLSPTLDQLCHTPKGAEKGAGARLDDGEQVTVLAVEKPRVDL